MSHNDENHEAVFRDNILGSSANMAPNQRIVSGIDFNKYSGRNITVVEMLKGMENIGFQATGVADAVNLMQEIMQWDKPSRFAETGVDNIKLFGMTSNMSSCGLRDIIRFGVEHNHVNCLVMTAGGVEEDLIKCLAPTYVGQFNVDDAELREKHFNRVGNLVIPNDNYGLFEDWLTPRLEKMLDIQEGNTPAVIKDPTMETLPWSPSSIIRYLGKEINDPSSICYWAQKNSIPVFCPALTDGSLGDLISMFAIRSQNRTQPASLVIDIASDIAKLNNMARYAQIYGAKMGAIILGGGLVKHHIMNACLNGGGADAAVYINTGQEYDGSDAGARPSEAVSWGKLKAGAASVKVFADASIVFPLLVAGSWARV